MFLGIPHPKPWLHYLILNKSEEFAKYGDPFFKCHRQSELFLYLVWIDLL